MNTTIHFSAQKSDKLGLIQEMVNVAVIHMLEQGLTGPFSVRVSAYGKGFTKIAQRNMRQATNGVGYIDYSHCWVESSEMITMKVTQSTSHIIVHDNCGDDTIYNKKTI